MKAAFLFLLLCAVTGLLSAFLPAKAPMERRSLTDGRPWNGGKPRGPFELTSPQSKELLPSEQDTDVDLFLAFQRPCTNLVTRVRGVGGVEVFGEPVSQHSSCEPSAPASRSVRVRLPAGTTGLLAVDVRYEMDGVIRQETRAIALRESTDSVQKSIVRQMGLAKQQGRDLHQVGQDGELLQVEQADSLDGNLESSSL